MNLVFVLPSGHRDYVTATLLEKSNTLRSRGIATSFIIGQFTSLSICNSKNRRHQRKCSSHVHNMIDDRTLHSFSCGSPMLQHPTLCTGGLSYAWAIAVVSGVFRLRPAARHSTSQGICRRRPNWNVRPMAHVLCFICIEQK